MRKVEAPRNVETGSKPQRWEVAEPAFSPSDFMPARGEGGKWARAQGEQAGKGAAQGRQGQPPGGRRWPSSRVFRDA